MRAVAAGVVVEAHGVEKRCGTCHFGQDYTCNYLRISVKREMRNGSDDGGYLTNDDGPPWDNCRFWQPKEKQP